MGKRLRDVSMAFSEKMLVFCWTTTLLLGSAAVCIAVVKWLLKLLGVIA